MSTNGLWKKKGKVYRRKKLNPYGSACTHTINLKWIKTYHTIQFWHFETAKGQYIKNISEYRYCWPVSAKAFTN